MDFIHLFIGITIALFRDATGFRGTSMYGNKNHSSYALLLLILNFLMLAHPAPLYAWPPDRNQADRNSQQLTGDGAQQQQQAALLNRAAAAGYESQARDQDAICAS